MNEFGTKVGLQVVRLLVTFAGRELWTQSLIKYIHVFMATT